MLASLHATLLVVTQAAVGVMAPAPTLFDGCMEVGPGPTCYVAPDATLTLWHAADADAVTPQFDGRTIKPQRAARVDGGTQLSLSLPQTEGTLSLRGAKDELTFELAVQRHIETAVGTTSWQSLRAVSVEEALERVNDALQRATPNERTELLRSKARLHTRNEEHNIAQGVFRAAIENARRQGQHYTALKCAAALAFSLRHRQRDTRAARAELDAVSDLIGAHGAARYLWLFHGGLVAYTADNARDQLDLFDKSAQVARRTAQPVREFRADMLLSVVHQTLGRRDIAGSRLSDWAQRLPAELSGCDRAIFWTNLSWNELLRLEAQEGTAIPSVPLEKSLQLSDEHCTATERINARLNMALALWHDNAPDEAQHYLDTARSLSTEPATHLIHWAMDIDGRIQASRGNIDAALARYEALADRAKAASLPATQWRALVRQAWTLRLAKRNDDAIDTYRAAERILDQRVLRVPLQAGRETLLATRRFAMREHLDLLQTEQRFDDALALMQRESSRSIEQIHIAAQLTELDSNRRQQWETYRADYQRLRATAEAEQAASWQLSRAELEQLERRREEQDRTLQRLLDKGVASFSTLTRENAARQTGLYTPTSPLLGIWQTGNGWAVVLDKGDGGAVGRSPQCNVGAEPDAFDTLAACLLDAVADELTDARSIALLVDDTLAGVDWHALAVGEQHWIDRLAVRYVSGLPVTTRATPAPGLALIVGDPSGNLRAARVEANLIGQRLRRSSAWRSDTLLGDRAGMQAVRSRIASAALFHYAGHAVFGDNSGWNSALLLANDTRIGVGDILTLEATPQLVVLSGCETARRSGVTTPAIGLAHAFLASGSSAVIATTRTVDDVSARAVMSAFYDRWLDGLSVQDALRAAQLQTRNEQPDLDWSAFRLIEP